MKKLGILTLILLLSTAVVFGQCAPDNSITDPGYYPDQLDTSLIGEQYDFELQILALRDTQVVYLGQSVTANIDSIKIRGVDGLPSGFTYVCNPVNCVYTHDAVGCATLSGNPTAQDVGVYPLQMLITAYAKVFSFSQQVNDTIRDFTLVIKDPSVSSTPEIVFSSDLTLYPNPTKGVIAFNGLKTSSSILEIYRMTGEKVISQVIKNGKEVKVDELTEGMYVYRVVDGEQVSHGKFVKE